MKLKYNLPILALCLHLVIGCNGTDEKHQPSYKKKNAPTVAAPVVAIDTISTTAAVKLAEAQFKQYLPTMLEANNAYVASQDTFTGDFTGDGIADIAIYFSLAPNEGGNTIVAAGLTLYQNDGKRVKVIAGYEPNYLFNFVKIENGKIHVEKLEYTDTDAKCCPSLKTAHALRISGGKAY